ncbi:Proline--tRNA ligase [Rhynchospora pubera]|uniref:Proline--tRNA ligase n=1 Tax=Rhynchospora pubera TaxID=906938 RepID=A0AAV8FTN9_9POAL|nr:Proline--tRNA ligase [Rhynchospora pubera]
MIEYYDISGCYILRPQAMSIWETLQLTMLISLGHRDLPLKLNQWGNVVRWEFSNPTPFISGIFNHFENTRRGRGRPRLTWEEAVKRNLKEWNVSKELAIDRSAWKLAIHVPEPLRVGNFYGRRGILLLQQKRKQIKRYLRYWSSIEEYMKGRKSELERCAGGLYITSVEAFTPHTGRGIQGATSHCLCQNFAKMFQINFEDDKGEKSMIGVMVMVHGDDKGLVLPPKVASVQVMVITVPYKDADTTAIKAACESTVRN